MAALNLLTEEDTEVSATAVLASAAVTAAGAMSEDGVKALLFLPHYLGRDGYQLAERILALKTRQTPGALGKLQKMMQAVALDELWNRININMGGK